MDQLLAAVAVLGVILVLIVVLILVLAPVLGIVLVVVLILISVLVIHNSLPPSSYLRTCRYHRMPQMSGFILSFENQACGESGYNCSRDTSGGGF